MKNTAIILSVFSLLSAYSCQKGIILSDKEWDIAKGLAQYFGGEVSVGKAVFYPLNGDERKVDLKITLECKDLKNYFAEPETPASYCAWQFFTQLPENERHAITKYIVKIPFDNQLRVIEYDPTVLQRVFDAKYMLDSISEYFIKGDYREMKSRCRADLKKEKGFSQFFEIAQKTDVEHGRTKSVEIRGFHHYEVQADSESTLLLYLVEFYVLQQRDSTHNKFSITVDPFSQDGFIAGLHFR